MKLKHTNLFSYFSASISALAIIASALVVKAAEGDNQKEFNKQYRSNYEVPLGDSYTGRSPYFKSSGKPAPAAPAPIAVTKEVAQKTPDKCSVVNSGLVHMSKTMPPEAQLGQEFTSELNLQAAACAGHIVVTDHIPAGTTYIKSEPPAVVEGDHLVWKFHEMEAGQTQKIKVTLRADKEGQLGSCATISADPRACASTLVGKPVLAIEKSGPERATINTDVTYNIVVSNKGSAVARNVVVTDEVPAGMKHTSGQSKLSFNVGDLAPNQSKSIPVTLKAAEVGKHCNNAIAQSDNAGKVSDDACTVVVKPDLQIVKTGDKEQFLGRKAKYNIEVSNTGDIPLTSVVVTDTAPAQTSIVEAPGATVSGNTATWNLGTLNAGEKKNLGVVLTSRTPGTWCNGATVACAEGLRKSSEACTLWKGVTALLIEVVDDPDPIGVGETTTYTIKVTNQGTADATNIALVSNFDEEVDPVSSAQGAVSGKQVKFPAVQRLASKASFTYTIIVKGVKVGDARNKVIMTANELGSPVVEEESTNVY